MSTEDNKATVRRFLEEVLNQGQVALIDELCAPDFQFHEHGSIEFRTREDYKQSMIENKATDRHFTIDDLIAEGDQVVVRYLWRETLTDDIVLPTMRIPATGKQLTFTGILIVRFVRGKAVEVWDEWDFFSAIQKLGLMSAPQAVG